MNECGTGELGQLQRDAVKAGRLPLRETINARMNAAADDRGRLESNLAGSLAMQNAAEYRRWLSTYVRHLSGDWLVLVDAKICICSTARSLHISVQMQSRQILCQSMRRLSN